MKSIGKYQVIEELGSSPTGTMFRVRDLFRHRELAIKLLAPVPGLSVESKEQICAFLASCAELTHRHIAKVYDLGEVDEGIFVATEWLSGGNLTKFLEQNPDLTLDQKLGTIAQVAEGLGFAHSRGIAHGNLKPSNIFVDTARDASILDFGSAKWLAALLDAGSRPQGLLANYLAPEQILGQSFDPRSDIFALGLMLYEAVAGRYPFSADAGLVPRDIVHTDAEPLRNLNPQAPEDLETLVARALHKDPAQRLQTAEEFASGLYLAAQHYRRAAAAELSGPPSSPPSTDNIFSQLPPALTPFATPPPPPPAPVAAASASQDVSAVRERPQDAEREPRPWTARSYVASAPLTKEIQLPRPASPAANTEPPKPPPFTPPEPFFEPPQSFLQPLPAPAPVVAPRKSGKLGKAILVTVAGLILAAIVVGSLMSRQNLRGAQNRSHSIPVASQPTPAVAPPAAPREQPLAPEIHAAKPAPPAANDTVDPAVSSKQILNGPVRTLWESGRYAQALAYVNQVLITDPDNEDARSWRKKIREAQAAEAALK